MDSLEDDGFGAQNDATYLIRLFGAARFEFSRLKQKLYSSPMNGDHRASSLRASRFRQRPIDKSDTNLRTEIFRYTI